MTLLWLAACGDSDTTLRKGTEENEDPVGAGAMTVFPEALVLVDLDVGISESTDLAVTSSGEGNLEIYQARLVANPDAVFYFETREDVVVATGDSVQWPVVATLVEEAEVYGKLRLETNDPDKATWYVPICAYPAGSTTDPATCGQEGDSGDSGGTATP